VCSQTKKAYRTSRLIGAHAYQIAASGAAMYASRVLAKECQYLKIDAETESSRAPWLPSISKGAKMVLEQFLCALAQEAAYKGHAVREGFGYSKRLSKTHTKLGWEATFDTNRALSSLMPKSVHVLPLAPKKRLKKGKAPPAEDDEEYAPPEGDENDDDDDDDKAEAEGNVDDLAPE
jgi:hypothetical protein